MAYNLQRDWESLYLDALYRASTLATTCDRFSDMTQKQINEFVKELEQFATDFEVNGPGSVGEDLERGLVRMDVSDSRKLPKLSVFLFSIHISQFCTNFEKKERKKERKKGNFTNVFTNGLNTYFNIHKVSIFH